MHVVWDQTSPCDRSSRCVRERPRRDTLLGVVVRVGVRLSCSMGSGASGCPAQVKEPTIDLA